MAYRWTRLAWAPLVLASLWTGCSLVDLASELDVDECDPERSVNQCNELPRENDDACEAWQCNRDTRRCEWGPRDDDNDGFQPVECAEGDAEPDCDDDDSERAPGLTETCDDKDNDCDSRLDEGALESAPTTLVFFDTDSVGSLSAAQNPETGSLGVLYQFTDGTTEGRLGGTLLASANSEDPEAATALRLDCDLAVAQNLVGSAADCSRQTSVRSYRAESLAAAPFDTDRMVVAFNRRDGADRRVTAGLWSGSALAVHAPIQQGGLRCEASEACRDDPDASHPRTEAISVGTATDPDRVLVAYVRNPDGLADACGAVSDVDGIQARLHLHLMDERTPDGERERALLELTAEPSVIDNVRATGGVQVLGVPSEALPDAGPNWLVGYRKGNGDLAVAHVSADGSDLTVASAELIRVPGGAELGDFAMAFGARDDGASQLGITFVEGCDDDALTRATIVELEADGADLTVTAEGTPRSLGGSGGGNEAAPSIAYNSVREVWGVSYRSARGLQARLMGRDGRPRGGESYTLVENSSGDGQSRRVLRTPTMTGFVPEGGNDWFSSVAFVLQSGEDASSEAQAVALTCSP